MRGWCPTEEELAAQNLQTRFVTGKLGMLLSSRREVPALREVGGLEWDVASLPVIGEPASTLHSDAYCISAGGDNVEAAADLVEFAVGQQGQTIAALSGRTVPSLRKVADSPAFLDPSRDPASSAGLPRRDPGHPAYAGHTELAARSKTSRRSSSPARSTKRETSGAYLDEIARQGDAPAGAGTRGAAR